MVQVTVELPSMLRPIVGGEPAIVLEAESLSEALRALITRHQALAVHLFDESGSLRQHVLCFLNQTNTRWLNSDDLSLSDGDTITILQAVSGG